MFRTIKNYNDSVKKQLPFRNKNLKTNIKKHAQSNVFFTNYLLDSFTNNSKNEGNNKKSR